jgi:hypothetical protein
MEVVEAEIVEQDNEVSESHTDYENYKNRIYKSNQLIESGYKLSVAEHRLVALGSRKLRVVVIDKNMPMEYVKNLIMTKMF